MCSHLKAHFSYSFSVVYIAYMYSTGIFFYERVIIELPAVELFASSKSLQRTVKLILKEEKILLLTLS
jgi:hypothetical protein